MVEISDDEYNEYLDLKDRQAGIVPKTNPPFVQFYKTHLPQIQWMIEENATAAAIWFYLVRGMDKKNMVIVSNKTLQDEFGLTRQYVSKCINFLKKHGFIVVHKIGTANAYSINHDLAWQSSNGEKQYAFDTANVIFSLDEQKGLPTAEEAFSRLESIGKMMEERELRVKAMQARGEETRIKIAKNQLYKIKQDSRKDN